MRRIAVAYKWPPSELKKLTLVELEYWSEAALVVMKGGYY